MTVERLKELLQGMPDKAEVIIKHELVGDENTLECITYSIDGYKYTNGKKSDGIIVLHEVI